MTRRWRDNKGDPSFVFHAWMQTVDELEDEIAELAAVLKATRPYVTGIRDQLVGTNARQIIIDAINEIDVALAKAEPHL